MFSTPGLLTPITFCCRSDGTQTANVNIDSVVDVIELTSQANSDITADICQEVSILGKEMLVIGRGAAFMDCAQTLLTNYDRTYPSGQIEEDCDGTLLFSKHPYEGGRSFSLIREKPRFTATCIQSATFGEVIAFSPLGKKSHLEAVSAFFRCLVPFALRRILHDAKY